MGIANSLINKITGESSTRDAEKYAQQGFNYARTNQNVLQAQEGGLQATNAVNALLGLGGDPSAQMGAFQRFRDSSGYQFRLGEGMKAITGSAAARGLLNSGASLKALNNYGQNAASAEFNNYLAQLMGKSDTGLNTALNVAGLGNQSGGNAASAIASNNASQIGAQQSIGSALIKSDDRLKTDIEPLAVKDGLPWHTYRYTEEAQKRFDLDGDYHVGVLAQDLLDTKYADAVVEEDGYLAVDYSKLPAPPEFN